MSWIASDQKYGRDPRTHRLARLLKVSKPTAIGLLHLVWWWCADFAEDGDLSKFGADDLADAAEWTDGEPSEFLTALLRSGFLVDQRELEDGQIESGLFLPPDEWWEIYGRYAAERKAARERAARSYAKSSRRSRVGGSQPPLPLRAVDPQPAGLPDRTGPDLNQDPPLIPPQAGGTPPNPPAARRGIRTAMTATEAFGNDHARLSAEQSEARGLVLAWARDALRSQTRLSWSEFAGELGRSDLAAAPERAVRGWIERARRELEAEGLLLPCLPVPTPAIVPLVAAVGEG